MPELLWIGWLDLRLPLRRHPRQPRQHRASVAASSKQWNALRPHNKRYVVQFPSLEMFFWPDCGGIGRAEQSRALSFRMGILVLAFYILMHLFVPCAQSNFIHSIHSWVSNKVKSNNIYMPNLDTGKSFSANFELLYFCVKLQQICVEHKFSWRLWLTTFSVKSKMRCATVYKGALTMRGASTKERQESVP